MTTQELHIGIDLALKIFNPRLVGRFLPQEKDYLLNKQIRRLIKDTVEDVKRGVYNSKSYEEIVNYYSTIEPYLIDKLLPLLNTNPIYNEYELPKYTKVITKKTQFIPCWNEYKVNKLGSLNIDLNSLNTTDASYLPTMAGYVEDDIFIFPSITSVPNGTTFNIYKGIVYKITYVDEINFTLYGATSNDIGTIFTATSTSEIEVLEGNTTKLEVLGVYLDSCIGVELYCIKNFSIFEYISLNIAITSGKKITSSNNATLVKGKKYLVTTGGEFTDIVTFGANWNVLLKGHIFTSTKDGRPTWEAHLVGEDLITSYIALEELVEPVCRLVTPQDSESMHTNEYENTSVGPFAIITNGKLRVYHDSKYDVANVSLLYAREPVSVDSIIGVECDLNSNLHDTIIGNVIQDIVSTNIPQLYPTVKDQNKS